MSVLETVVRPVAATKRANSQAELGRKTDAARTLNRTSNAINATQRSRITRPISPKSAEADTSRLTTPSPTPATSSAASGSGPPNALSPRNQGNAPAPRAQRTVHVTTDVGLEAQVPV